VDSNGLLPMRAEARTFGHGLVVCAHVQRTLPALLLVAGSRRPRRPSATGRAAARSGALERWPPTPAEDLERPEALIARPDRSTCCRRLRGGTQTARAALDRFVHHRLARYADDHTHPDAHGTSGLSPSLHFGHIPRTRSRGGDDRGEMDVAKIAPQGRRQTHRLVGRIPGRRSFLDQLVTWRELRFNLCATRPTTT
jgi:deoxyribodipyrimidine photo-lyase